MITSFEALVYRNMRNKTNLFCSTEILWFWLGFLKFSLFVYLFCCCLLELFGFWGSLGFFGGGGKWFFCWFGQVFLILKPIQSEKVQFPVSLIPSDLSGFGIFL